MKITPKFGFDKYDFGFGIVLNRSNDSKKYIRKYKTITYSFGVKLLWLFFVVEIELEGVSNEC